jgi:hypothetical protein
VKFESTVLYKYCDLAASSDVCMVDTCTIVLRLPHCLLASASYSKLVLCGMDLSTPDYRLQYLTSYASLRRSRVELVMSHIRTVMRASCGTLRSPREHENRHQCIVAAECTKLSNKDYSGFSRFVDSSKLSEQLRRFT